MAEFAFLIIAGIAALVAYLAIEKEDDRPSIERALGDEGYAVDTIQRKLFWYFDLLFRGAFTISRNARVFVVSATDSNGKRVRFYAVIDPLSSKRLSTIPYG